MVGDVAALLAPVPHTAPGGRLLLFLPAALLFSKLRASCSVEAVPDPVGQGPPVLVGGPLVEVLLFTGQTQVEAFSLGLSRHTHSVRKTSARFNRETP